MWTRYHCARRGSCAALGPSRRSHAPASRHPSPGLDTTALRREPTVVEGPAALDILLQPLTPKLAETWPGDETLVGIVAEQGGRAGIVWMPLDRAVAKLGERRGVEPNPRRRTRYEAAVTTLSGPGMEGKIAIVVAGCGDLVAIELEADDLRTGKRVTSWTGGSA